MPSISLLEHHAAAAIEIWNVLKLFPIERRFQMYGEWKDSIYRRIPALSVRKAEAERDVKGILRRLSTENVKKLGKTLAKIAHTNPTVIFAIALNQVQSYDNLILPVVEVARYLTEFGYDVMTYSILDALSSGKTKTKDDGTSVALWLQGEKAFLCAPVLRFITDDKSESHRIGNVRSSIVSSMAHDVRIDLDRLPIPRQSTR